MIGRHAMERHSAGTLFLATDFESVMSTNFITLASNCMFAKLKNFANLCKPFLAC